MKNLEEIQRQIEVVLSEAGIPSDRATELRNKLLKLQKDKDRKLLASEIAREIAREIAPLIKGVDTDALRKELAIAVKGMKIEPIVNVKAPEPKVIVREPQQPKIVVNPPKVTVNPAKVVVKAQEFKAEGFFKKLLDIFKTKQEATIPKGTIPVELEFEGKKYRAMGGGGGPSRVFIKNSSNQTIDPISEVETPVTYNVRIDIANTEYSQAIPNGTKRIRAYLIDGNKRYPYRDTLKLSWDEGESGGTPMSIPANGVYQEGGLKLSDKTLYFQVPTATSSPYVIISCWQ